VKLVLPKQQHPIHQGKHHEKNPVGKLTALFGSHLEEEEDGENRKKVVE
jgi:hypothetical protein